MFTSSIQWLVTVSMGTELQGCDHAEIGGDADMEELLG
jgi:hypothetical protein